MRSLAISETTSLISLWTAFAREFRMEEELFEVFNVDCPSMDVLS